MVQQQTEQEITRLLDGWSAAELHGDVAFLERTLAGDFIGVGPLGFMLSKPEWLARHETGELKYRVHTFDDVTMRVYDQAAIAIGRLTQEATYRDNPFNAQLRTTLIVVPQNGQWRIAGLQFSAMGQFQLPIPTPSQS